MKKNTNLIDKNKNILFIFLLSVFAFTINYLVANRGVFPVDTFIHFDQGFRILQGDHPIKDYWIVHGFFIDYLQAIFFYFFGNKWLSYIIHSSLLNLLLTVSFYIFITKILKIDSLAGLFFSLCFSILAYPISGTPFLDLHSIFFSLLSIFFILTGIIREKKIFWFLAPIFFSLAFLSKQVPASYIIITSSIFCFYYSVVNKNFNYFFYYILGGFVSLILFFLFLSSAGIKINDLFIQLFLFPKTIGGSRFLNYELNFKNLFLDYKFIYFFLIINFIFYFKAKKKKKSGIFKDKSFNIILVLTLFSFSSIFHQIYTKNQTFIFFLIPILSSITYLSLKKSLIKRKKFIAIFIITSTALLCFKYAKRFDYDRKFHELSNTKFEKSIKFDKFDKKFKGLKWISPYYKDPKKEIELLLKILKILKKDEENVMFITEYNFFSLTLSKNLYSPSRTYDDISYPLPGSKYFKSYKDLFLNILKKNDVGKIYILENKKITNQRLEHLVFNYVSPDCFIVSENYPVFYILKIKDKCR